MKVYFKQLFSLILTTCLFAGMTSIMISTVEGASSADANVILNIPWKLINQCGSQSVSGPCQAYSMAYCRIILENKSHVWTDYRQKGCTYRAVSFDTVGYNNKHSLSTDTVLTETYASISRGQPVILNVKDINKSSTQSTHYVTAVGYKANSNPDNLQQSDFIILDPANKEINPKAGSKETYSYLGSKWELRCNTNNKDKYQYGVAKSGSVSVLNVDKPNGGSISQTIDYFSCNTIISCFNGQTVNLYNNPGDSSRVTYFSKGQTVTSTYGATLSDGSKWYRVSVNHNGSNRLLWLKCDDNKMTCQEKNETTKYKVVLDNGSSCRQITVTNGETYGNLGTPTKDGYTFDGWYTREYGGSKVTSSTTVDLTSDQTLYAHWTKIEAAHTEHTKTNRMVSENHPHNVFYTCSVCGEVFTDGSTESQPDSCITCFIAEVGNTGTAVIPEPEPTGYWGTWSNWSTSPVYASSNREVETQTVKVSDGYTEYRYGRYIDGTGGHVGWCATYLSKKGYSGITTQYSNWTTSRYSTSGKGWTCGSCGGNHVGVDHYGSDGRAWWGDYVSPRSGSFFWEESRAVDAEYETQYRYRDWIGG